jgi:hypothetical protein
MEFGFDISTPFVLRNELRRWVKELECSCEKFHSDEAIETHAAFHDSYLGLMMSAFLVRRLIELKDVTDTFLVQNIFVRKVPATRQPRNSYMDFGGALENNYDLKSTHKISFTPEKLCHLLVHRDLCITPYWRVPSYFSQ